MTNHRHPSNAHSSVSRHHKEHRKKKSGFDLNILVPSFKAIGRLKAIGAAAVVAFLIIGLASASMLSLQNQDVRSDASQKPQPPALVCQSEKTTELWVRTQSRTGVWSSWAGPNSAVDSTGQGLLTSLAMYSPIDGPMGYGSDLTQYAVKGGQLWVRAGELDRNWSNWAGPNSAVDSVGTGSLTSFSAISDTVSMASSRIVVKQYAVKGGQLFVRSMASGAGWTNWAGPNSAVDSVGTGVLTGFSMTIEPATNSAPNGVLKQYAVKGGQLWVRTSANGAQWTSWVGPNLAAGSVGGKLISFNEATDVTTIGSPYKQYATVEKEKIVCN